MNDSVEQLVSYIQERCLWQFFSRSWDREENIEGILNKTGEILAGEQSSVDTAADRCFYADAKILVSEFKSKFPWIMEKPGEEVKNILAGVKERLRTITIDKSLNAELKVPNY